MIKSNVWSLRITIAFVLFIAIMFLFTLSPLVWAANTAPQPPGEVLTGLNLIDVLLGALVPAVGYVLNHYMPWTTEQIKWGVQVVLAAGVGAAHQMIGDGNFGWNTQTGVAILTVMGTALVAHMGYKTGAINTFLGGGMNHNTDGPDSTSPVRPGLSK